MIPGKRSPFGPKVELLVVLPQQARHPIPLLSPILAHRAYASANEKESTGGRLASDHIYQALRAAAAWHAHHETALASPERGSPSLARRMGWHGPSARNPPARPSPPYLPLTTKLQAEVHQRPLVHLTSPAESVRNRRPSRKTQPNSHSRPGLTTAPVGSPHRTWRTSGAPLSSNPARHYPLHPLTHQD